MSRRLNARSFLRAMFRRYADLEAAHDQVEAEYAKVAQAVSNRITETQQAVDGKFRDVGIGVTKAIKRKILMVPDNAAVDATVDAELADQIIGAANLNTDSAIDVDTGEVIVYAGNHADVEMAPDDNAT